MTTLIVVRIRKFMLLPLNWLFKTGKILNSVDVSVRNVEQNLSISLGQ